MTQLVIESGRSLSSVLAHASIWSFVARVMFSAPGFIAILIFVLACWSFVKSRRV